MRINEAEHDIREKHKVKELPISHQIPGVPDLFWPKTGWCGYTSTAMVMQYWWGGGNTDVKVFEKFQDKFTSPKLASISFPNAQILAKITKELIDPEPKASVIAGNYYPRNGRNPHEVLQKFISNDIPCIVRVPGHFKVAVGYDEDTYTFHDPAARTSRITDKKIFDNDWKMHDHAYPNNSSYLILAIYPADRDLIVEKQVENEERRKTLFFPKTYKY
jgi:hypothetical protein